MYQFLSHGECLYTTCLAVFCGAIWNRINKACFDKKFSHHPVEIVFYDYANLNYCTGLHSTDNKNIVQTGAQMLMSQASSATHESASSPNVMDTSI